LCGGVKGGLGSDVAGGCHPSIFHAMTDAIQVSKLRWRLVDEQDPPLTFAEAFHMATVSGGAFFGRVGTFEAGYELDALVIDDRSLASMSLLTLAERLERVAYLSDDRNIVEKYVRGKRLY
ncbi:MAG: amidohydrolase family protein, partial [Clostridia bacterium]|nr:amidohydrolase family protein [Clostridia bacterium]